MAFQCAYAIWLILPAQSMGKLAKSLKNSIWDAIKILNGTRYAEQNWEVCGTPWGEGGIASCTPGREIQCFTLGKKFVILPRVHVL